MFLEIYTDFCIGVLHVEGPLRVRIGFLSGFLGVDKLLRAREFEKRA